MKTLNFVLIAILILSCSPENSTDDQDVNTSQDHYKVNYRTECGGDIMGFYHVSNEEWANREMLFPDGDCWYYKLKDMDGVLRHFNFHSFEKPCPEH